jgi:hypothetical protein
LDEEYIEMLNPLMAGQMVKRAKIAILGSRKR